MATGTLTPTPWQTTLDANGNPVSGALITTYLAGTTTPVATYTDVNLSVANANPIVADSAGRWVAYLTPGVSYKFVETTAASVAIRTQDNIAAVPATASNQDVTGIAGQTLTAGSAVYMSDGSGGKTSGSWYLADSANTYSSTTPEVGIVPSTIANASSGTIRLGGQVTIPSSLSVGAEYFVGTAGALTSTAPANSRHLGHADTATSLILTSNPGQPAFDNGVQDFRLTLTTGVPVTASDVTAATTLYASPYRGNRIVLFSSTGIPTALISAEFSVAVPATTSQMYDIFAYNNSGVATLELLAWTNDTTRATALVLTTTGTYTKSGDLTRRYLGSFRTTTVSGQTEDSATKRYVWNCYHRVSRSLVRKESTASWAWHTVGWQRMNASTSNQVDFVIGLSESPVSCSLVHAASQSVVALEGVAAAIALDSATVPSGLFASASIWDTGGSIGPTFMTCVYSEYPGVGRHFLAALEYGSANATFYGVGPANVGPAFQTGLSGTMFG